MAGPNVAPHYAEQFTHSQPTGRLRFVDGILEQEWGCQWRNELGSGFHTEWHRVPSVSTGETHD
jgi:hypothetical protein